MLVNGKDELCLVLERDLEDVFKNCATGTDEV
jgi:hypothetical protein